MMRFMNWSYRKIDAILKKGEELELNNND